MPTNEEVYSKQRDSAANLLESECATEMLKIHHAFAKPSFALSRWLLAANGAVATILLTNVQAAAGLFGESWLLFGLVLLLLGGIVGLFAITIEGVIAARVAGLTSLGTLADTVLPKLSEYNRRLAQYAVFLNLKDQKNVPMPDLEKMSEWFQYPVRWCSRWTYGRAKYTDKGEQYKDVVTLLTRQACMSRLQLLLVVAVFGIALVDIAQQRTRDFLPITVKATAPTSSMTEKSPVPAKLLDSAITTPASPDKVSGPTATVQKK